jgi:lipoprotein-anchoring transpeptidase ErfK/SrfK
MQLKTVVVACAVLTVGAEIGAILPGSASCAGTSAASVARPQSASMRAPRGDRIFLSPAQLAEARATGTLDRPVKSLLPVNKQLQYGDYVWNDAGVPAGQTWVRVDLHSQLMSVFQAGHEIGTAVIVYGGDNKQTPTGKLHILAKARKHRSSLYDAEMPYTLRLTGDGVSIHGSNVRWGAATHGCIGVPIVFARHLFDATQVGDEVVVIPAARPS